jgi:hypothetical protein
MADDSDFVTLIRKAHPHLQKDDIMTFGLTEKTGIGAIDVEVDDAALEWWFRELPHDISKALRIPYRYVRRSDLGEVHITDHLLIGYEGYGSSGKSMSARRIERTPSSGLQLIRTLSSEMVKTVGKSPRSDYDTATILKKLTYERLTTTDVASKYPISLFASLAIEVVLLVFAVLYIPQSAKILSAISSIMIGSSYAASINVMIPQWTIVGLLFSGVLLVFFVIGGLLWAGFIATQKDETARFLITHIVTSLVSAAVGAVGGFVSHGAMG